ncbi:hypothetical protein CEUSTIGMA_g2025.t1 [Chlamydomonas eustigma]|uniref:Guanylate cyclase domain-containing protein n=1 Tax=Chlamydomonas eustigma TaxID=1157962 RepID=A0A250WUZ7_9CHLO|nr:hypothetical protein CEUSTIGMA_g2025.t1 [Chlamydomonas eustigma]|eukprot:GAX74576.1 hypothetical protein CEUSTIGMA_g2025.t1 [Chlamydomonas eustigma]
MKLSGRSRRLLFFLLPFFYFSFSPVNGSCDAVSQQTALVNFFYSTGGYYWSNHANWLNSSFECIYTARRAAQVQPSHCCWHGVTCCSFPTCDPASADVGSLECACEVGLVTGLTLNRNNVTSDLSSALGVLNATACSLKVFQGRQNPLSGTLPASISLFSNLTVLSLGGSGLISGSLPTELGLLPYLNQMDLSGNVITGTVPSGLCSSGKFKSNLQDLILGYNFLHGTFDVPGCTSLIRLDLSDNYFTGLGSFETYPQLRVLRLSSNFMVSPVPKGLPNSLLLTDFTNTNNLFYGNLDLLPTFTYLATLRLYNNSMTGTLPSTMFENMGLLRAISLGSNSFSGTIPESIGLAPLTTIYFNNNSLYGTIPDVISAQPTTDVEADFRLNFLFCCGVGWDGSPQVLSYSAINESLPRLPSSLRFSTIKLPQTPIGKNATPPPNWGTMSCPGFVDIRVYPDIPPGGDTVDMLLLKFNIDPVYYLYENCGCTSEYRFTQVSQSFVGGNVPVYACILIEESWFYRNKWIIAVIVVGALILLSWSIWYLCYHRSSRPYFVQAFVDMRKRLRGEPSEGVITVVHVAVEGCKELTAMPVSLFKQSMIILEEAVKKARWTSFGYILDKTDAGSFSIGFSEAMDATVFTLILQQSLMKQPWPEGLKPRKSEHEDSKRAGSSFLADVARNVASWVAQPSRFKMQAPVDLTSSASVAASEIDMPERPLSTLQGIEVKELTLDSVLNMQPGAACFCGLRARIGLATGVLERNEEIRKSLIYSNAKMICDAAAGGQSLMDQKSFLAIKERLEELGAVDHTGINTNRLLKMRRSSWLWCWGSKRTAQHEPLVLDMGEYIKKEKSLQDIRLDITTGAAMLCTHDNDTSVLRLYQILPPSLVARAKLFGNAIALPKGWVCVDNPYFCGPGTLAAPLVGMSESAPTSLPNVTMVFCCVDGGKDYAKKHREEAHVIHTIIAGIIHDTMRQVPGSYLCRMQDGDLKYMVVFSTPAAAIAWCLVMQETMLYASWPPSVLSYVKFRTEYSQDQRLMFRGPRLKMGVCEGQPKTIIPDHLARADYHGASINQSARYMDAGAHGGQVVCEEKLALEVLTLYKQAAALEEGQHGGDDLSAPEHLLPGNINYGGVTGSVDPDSGLQLSSSDIAAKSLSPAGRKPPPSDKPERQINDSDRHQTRQVSTVEEVGRGPADAIVETDPSGSLAARIVERSHAVETGLTRSVASGSGQSALPWNGAVNNLAHRTNCKSLVIPRDDCHDLQPNNGSDTHSINHTAVEPHHWYMSKEQSFRTSVLAFRTGIFRFKGNNEDVHMVHLTTEPLMFRMFPSEPPKGKGNRIAEAAGLIMKAEARLPNSSITYREKSFFENEPVMPVTEIEEPIGRLQSVLRQISLTAPQGPARAMSMKSSFSTSTGKAKKTRALGGSFISTLKET